MCAKTVLFIPTGNGMQQKLSISINCSSKRPLLWPYYPTYTPHSVLSVNSFHSSHNSNTKSNNDCCDTQLSCDSKDNFDKNRVSENLLGTEKFFVGGLTFASENAINFLEKQKFDEATNFSREMCSSPSDENIKFWHNFCSSFDAEADGPPSLSHMNRKGDANMVDVSHKKETLRRASARALVIMPALCYQLAVKNNLKKGDLLATARLAGIMAAKRTSSLIPLCHPIPIEHVEVKAEFKTREAGAAEHSAGAVEHSAGAVEHSAGAVEHSAGAVEHSAGAVEHFAGAVEHFAGAVEHSAGAVEHSAGAVEHFVELTSEVRTVGRTGVEMEALTAVSVAALTVYDMCKAVSHDIVIRDVQLLTKSGGKKDFVRRP